MGAGNGVMERGMEHVFSKLKLLESQEISSFVNPFKKVLKAEVSLANQRAAEGS